MDDVAAASRDLHVRLEPALLLRRATRVLVAVWCVLLVGALVATVLQFGLGRATVFGLVPFFDLSEEGGLGTWVAALLLLSCGLLAAGNALVARRAGCRWQRNWWLLAAVLAAMSLDEVARIHDRISPVVQSALGTSGFLYFAWVVPVLALGLAFLVYQARFLRALGRTGLLLVLAGSVFVVGAAGFEMAQAVLRDDGGQGSTWDVFPLVEELLEFAGAMWALRILLARLLETAPRTTTVELATAEDRPRELVASG